MQVKPFTLLGQSVLDRVQAALAARVASWGAEWGVAPGLFSLRAARACDSAMPARAAWIELPSELAGELQRAMFAADAASAGHSGSATQFAAATARAAFDALAAALGGACLADSQVAPGAGLWARGAGAVLVTLAVGTRQGRLLLDDASVRALDAAAPAAVLPALAAVDLRAAVAAQPVALQLAVGQARVAVGSLLTLCVGDVIRLDTAADAPVTLSAPDGTALLAGWLGRVGLDVAVEIAGPYSSPIFGVVQ